MSELPQGWDLVSFPQVCELNPRKQASDYPDAEMLVTFVPMAAVDAASGTIAAPVQKTYSDVSKGFTAFLENDVIMAKITPCMENGKAAIARNLINGLGFGSTEFHVFRSKGTVLPEYIFHYIRQERFRKEAERNFTGSVGQRRVPLTFLENSGLPVPPLKEQKRIVEKLEELVGKVEAAQERLNKIPAILKRFRQSVLAAACSGRLTVDWRSANGFGDEWRFSTVKDVCARIVDCPHSTPRWSDTGEICVRTTNFKANFLDLSVVRYVSEDTYKERNKRLEPKAGDILYSREGGILGIACMVPDDVRLCLGQRMMMMRTNADFEPKFLMFWLNSPEILDAVEGLTGGSAAPHLNVGDIKNFIVPVPREDEQKEIVRRVEELFELADQIESRYKKARSYTDRLTQSILAKAFSGDLVPQDPNDEPASKLLERIREEKK